MFGVGEITLLISIGLVAGFVAGLIGIGGGLFYVLLYSFFLSKLAISNEEEFVRLVISNSIVSTFFAALAAMIKHIKNQNFYWRPVLLIGIPGLCMSIFLTLLIAKFPFYNRKLFAVVFTLAVIPLIWKMSHKPIKGNKPIKLVKPYKLSLVGLVSGAGTALSGLGGAFIVTPFLNGLFSIDIKKVVSISIGVIVIVAGGTTLFNLFSQAYETQLPYMYGGIHLLMILPVVVSVMVAAPLGVRVSQKVSPKFIRILFLLFCLGIIVRNMFELFM